jgi:hypothetical protein
VPEQLNVRPLMINFVIYQTQSVSLNNAGNSTLRISQILANRICNVCGQSFVLAPCKTVSDQCSTDCPQGSLFMVVWTDLKASCSYLSAICSLLPLILNVSIILLTCNEVMLIHHRDVGIMSVSELYPRLYQDEISYVVFLSLNRQYCMISVSSHSYSYEVL